MVLPQRRDDSHKENGKRRARQQGRLGAAARSLEARGTRKVYGQARHGAVARCCSDGVNLKSPGGEMGWAIMGRLRERGKEKKKKKKKKKGLCCTLMGPRLLRQANKGCSILRKQRATLDAGYGRNKWGRG